MNRKYSHKVYDLANDEYFDEDGELFFVSVYLAFGGSYQGMKYHNRRIGRLLQ